MTACVGIADDDIVEAVSCCGSSPICARTKPAPCRLP